MSHFWCTSVWLHFSMDSGVNSWSAFNLAHRLSGQLNFVCIAPNPIQDCICQRGIFHRFLPLVDWILTGHNGRAYGVAIIQEFDQIPLLYLSNAMEPPVVQDQDIGASQLHDGQDKQNPETICSERVPSLQKDKNLFIHGGKGSVGVITNRIYRQLAPKEFRFISWQIYTHETRFDFD